MSKKSLHNLRVRSTKYGAGKGLYAENPIPKGDFVIEYLGNKIKNDIADTLGTRYLFDLENGYTLDGSPQFNTARWINHACSPNVEAELDEDEARIFIYAAKDIQAGEELTIDYGTDYFDDFIRPQGCKCAGCVVNVREAPALVAGASVA